MKGYEAAQRWPLSRDRAWAQTKRDSKETSSPGPWKEPPKLPVAPSLRKIEPHSGAVSLLYLPAGQVVQLFEDVLLNVPASQVSHLGRDVVLRLVLVAISIWKMENAS